MAPTSATYAARDRLDQVGDSLPAFSAVVQRLLATVDCDDIDACALASIVGTDPGLTATLLRAGNGAAFKTKHGVDNVRDAIARIGVVRSHRIALSKAIANVLPPELVAYNIPSKKLWIHSISVAVLSEETARATELRTPLAYTAGLLHDIGKIAMNSLLNDSQDLVELLRHDQLTIEEAEAVIAGVDHCELGAMLAESWRLPPSIVAAIRWHHAPHYAPPEHRTLVDLVHAADVYGHFLGLGDTNAKHRVAPDPSTIDRLSLDTAMFQDVAFRSLDAIVEMRDL